MLKGLAVSPGVAIGVAYCVNEIILRPAPARLGDGDITAELAKYETARDAAAKDLTDLEVKVATHVGKEESAIFSAQRTILRDPAFTNNVRNWIVEERITAQASLHRLLENYTDLFSRLPDEYLKERLHDIRDVILRVNSHLSEPITADSHEIGDGPLILVAKQLLPSQVVTLGDIEVRGIITESGSQTSHAAIVARSRGIPAVSDLSDLLSQVATGDTVIVDGREGRVIVNPDAETRAAYLKLEREFFHFRDHLAENRDDPARSRDGDAIELLANINSVADATAAVAMGATGVGLYRTEYLYLTHPVVPGEEEQLEEYCRIIEASPNHRVTIRTFDLGGDKTVPFLGHVYREANPFMGWRSIRLCFEHPQFLNTQLRAIMRSAAVANRLGGEVRLMFPMVTSVEEIHQLMQLVGDAKRELSAEGKEFSDVPTGIMLEVPAAAISVDTMISLVNFVSIGSNDLIQYLMAADRDNPKVSHLCQPLAPPVLRLLRDVIGTCRRMKVPFTLCGEMAGQPRAFALLYAMGLRSFSMSPAFVPYIKKFATCLSTEVAEELLSKSLAFSTTNQIDHFMTTQLKQIFPDFEQFDVV